MSRKRRRQRNKIHPNTPLTITPRFGEALERYAIGRIKNLPVQWEWVGVGLAALILGASLAAGYLRSSLISGNIKDIIVAAASAGDYPLAVALYRQHYESQSTNTVLGVDADLEELVYPERRLYREIATTEAQLTQYPSSRDLLLTLSQLYREVGDHEKASTYREQARVLDPNNEIFK